MLIEELRKIDPDFDAARLMFTEHHHAHAASAFFPSPFEEALVLTVDGRRRMVHDHRGARPRQPDRYPQRDPFPAQPRPVLFSFHLLHRLSRQSGEYKLMGWRPTASRVTATSFATISSI